MHNLAVTLTPIENKALIFRSLFPLEKVEKKGLFKIKIIDLHFEESKSNINLI